MLAAPPLMEALLDSTGALEAMFSSQSLPAPGAGKHSCVQRRDSSRRRSTKRYHWVNMKYLLALLPVAFLLSCSPKQPQIPFSTFADEFVYTTLSFSPVSAAAQGLHSYKGENFDTELDDVSPRGVNRQRDFYTAFHRRLAALDANHLSPEDRADYDIIEDQIALGLFDLDIAQTWRHSPQSYVELAGQALFSPYVLEYAPKPERAKHVIARLEKIPAFLEQAQRHLFGVPAIWIKVAREENDGNVALVDKTLRSFIPEDQRAAFDHAAQGAIEAFHGFDRFLADKLPRRRGGEEPDWRLGPDNYKTKFRFALGTDRPPNDVLAEAERDVNSVRGRMLELSRQILVAHHQQAQGDESQTISQALNLVAEKHSTPDSYIADARADLEEARNFVREKSLLTLPARDNLKVIETPAFMRGIYAVGGFNPAPVLEPQLGAFYWVTPVPKDWDRARIESKLREYNFYKLKLLTIHEAMPGHYVQFEFANDIQPKSRRVLRAVYGNTPYIEGWAQYATQTMLDEGFLNNSPELRLTFLKEELRVLANAIIDIRLQSKTMTEQEALDFMEKRTFQEREEATAKLQRAQLSSAQLPAYLVGSRGWLQVREQYKTKLDAHAFHDAALKEGAVPLPVLGRLLK